ncbi:MAG: HEAT repeat domain-containing protein [Natronomonas sp.]
MSLFELEREGEIDELIDILQTSDTIDIRSHAAEILGRLGSGADWHPESEPVSALVGMARTDESPVVRAAAVDALDEVGLDAIQRLLLELSNSIDRSAIEGAGWVSANAIGDVLTDDLPELRMAAATALGKIGDADAVGPLVQRLGDSDERVRVRAARSCGRIGDPRAVDPLIERLSDPVVEVRRATANALGRIGTQRSIGALRSLLDDESEAVRRIAVDGLGNANDPRAAETLVEALNDESDVVARGAVLSLVELLSNAPAKRSHEMREAAVETLETAAADRVIPPLVDLTESDLDEQRRNATWLLGRVATKDRTEVTDSLVSMLSDSDTRTSQFAATSLVELNDDGVEDELISFARNENADVEARSKAVYVLGNVGGVDAREELSRLVETVESDTLRKQILSALSKLGGTNVEPDAGKV